MTAIANLDDGNHTAGDDFDRLLTLSVNVSSFSALKMTVRTTWAPDDENTDAGPEVLAQISLGAGITQVDDTTVRCQIPGSQLRKARLCVYDVQGTTLLGKTITIVRGTLPLLPQATAS